MAPAEVVSYKYNKTISKALPCDKAVFVVGKNYFFLPAFGLFAPYLERLCIRPFTP
jgi:hypothetical protein